MATNKKSILIEEDELLEKQQAAEEQKDPDVEDIKDDVNTLDLPSGGLLGYPSTISYRDILVKDEETLASATTKTYTRTLNKVLKSIANNCDFFEKLTIHDRDYFLVWVWANNYSPTKKVEVECPHCKDKHEQTVDFTKQDTSDLNKKFKGFYEMELKSGHTAKIRLNTVADEMAVETYMANDKNARFDHLMLVRSIDLPVSMPLKNKIEWVAENVTGAEMAKIKKFHITLKYGIDPSVKYTCKACGGEFFGDFPFQTEDIIFPTVQADIDEFL